MQDVLKILEKNARAVPEDIALRTGRSVEDVEDAIIQYEKKGVIRRYKTVIDWDRFGEERVYAYIDVSVTPQRGAGYDDIARRIYKYPEVKDVCLVSGGHDLRVIVVGAGIKEVANFVAEKLATLEHVTATNTHFLLKRYKEDGEIFVENDVDERLMVSP